MSKESEFEQTIDDEVEIKSRREERREQRAQRRADRVDGGLGWVAGLVFIAIGSLFLLQNFGYVPALTNWWALFLLLPAVGTLAAARGAYASNGGHWTAQVTGPFLAGLFFLGLTVIFLFGLDFSWVLPLFMIVAGMFLIFSPALKSK